jgi:hypothetical protein
VVGQSVGHDAPEPTADALALAELIGALERSRHRLVQDVLRRLGTPKAAAQRIPQILRDCP